MTMHLEDVNGTVIADYNPDYKYASAENLRVTFKVDFSNDREMFESLYRKYRFEDGFWKFDIVNYKVTLKF